ncbi:hypothetical protein BDA99DRAFT_536567 [Phascolomyces articulosus]|uniref:F-box domain-containing protein n=1 Tax=Phascolomyces articulosus TaxID=60185 RepID=A0AAD5PEV2_9FUNG|nr:hypothetical protein BDA99DRAFT_536567 [Phascolomyces articulosus]
MLSTSIIAPHFLDVLESFPHQIHKINKAIQSSDHQQIIEYVSATIDYVYQQKKLLLALLEIRSHAYLMNGRFNDAFYDGEKMIEEMPKSIAGYTRKGHLLSMYGHQLKAIECYDKGLEVAQEQQQAGQNIDTEDLDMGKEIAIELSEKTIDPILTLPEEIATSIIILLSQDVRMTCMQVSKTWQTRILDCKEAWRKLSIQNGSKNIPLLRFTSYLCHHVKDLSINTTSATIHSRFVNLLQNGHFDRIQSLGLTDMESYIGQTPSVLRQIRQTLTKLDINVFDNQNSITIRMILSSCESLTDLIYRTKCSLSNHMVDFTSLQQHPSLINVELNVSTITGQDIEPIIQVCQQLRRLVMHYCDDTVYSIIAENSTPNLEILACNFPEDEEMPIPKLSEKKVLLKQTAATTGLKVLYLDPRVEIPPSNVLPIVYKNRSTLQDIALSMQPVSEDELRQIYAKYSYFTLPKVKMLMTQPLLGIQEFMMQAIQYSKLEEFYVASVHDMNLMVKTLLDMPPLRILEIVNVHDHTTTTALNQLLKKYAQLSVDSSQSPLSLEKITFVYCRSVMDETLEALIHIKTLNCIELANLSNTSTQGVKKLINNLGHQVKKIFLDEMDSVMDEEIESLGDVNGLNTIILQNLCYITDDGVRNLVDKKSNLKSTWTLQLTNCPRISHECLHYVKQKTNCNFIT